MEKQVFEEKYNTFKRRQPAPRYGNKIDTTAIRFVDVASKEQILKEYNLNKEKKSDLSSKERSIITKMVEG